jgi:hypothetical protein
MADLSWFPKILFIREIVNHIHHEFKMRNERAEEGRGGLKRGSIAKPGIKLAF